MKEQEDKKLSYRWQTTWRILCNM